MASKEEELPNIPPAVGISNGHTRRDTAAATVASHDAKDQLRKKRQKWLLNIVFFIIYQSTVIAVFTLTIMKIRTPKFSVLSATFDEFNVNNSTTYPSLSTRMNVEFRIKNSNFGRFKYRNTTVYFSYQGMSIGEALVSKSYAKWKSTRRFVVAVDLDFAGVRADPRLVSDLDEGVVPILSHAGLRGKVELLFVMTKSKSTYMNCSMEILTATQELRNIGCS